MDTEGRRERKEPTARKRAAATSRGARPRASRSAASRNVTSHAAASRPATSRPATPRPAASRPAAASRGRSATGPEQAGSTAWVRGMILASILVMLAVTLAPTARSLMRQRGDIAALQERVFQQQQHVVDLQKEQARWNDPAYVEQQARERLKFVKVGDRSYTVIDGKTQAPQVPPNAVVAAPSADGNAPWYGRLWQSVRLADQPTAGMAPVPEK